ncbi:FKBP-type peptidyl-prolyl cis-trans isomerase [Pedobacter alpinus]|uniref:Peptidyl-prolyl cis-trans isomerase n=1 Tax=Pedobacter alpinus TaxID=1590643 RepID=A0ABW5TUL9_9SPHI
MIKKYLSLLILAVVFLSACEKETRSLKEIEDETIQSYLRTNNLTGFTKDSTGFYFKVISLGTGDVIGYPTFVGVSQTTTSINKSVNYEFSKYNPQFNYVGYITPTSWRESMLNIRKGGELRIITPSYLAFGKDGSGSTLPGNAILDTKLSVANDADRPSYEDALIREYLTENNLTATKDANGIYYNIETLGTGAAITPTSSIKVAYTGKLLTGAIFDQALPANPLTISLANTIEGWKLAVPLIKVGGKIKIYIPSRFGYGANAQSTIPANSILEFEIQVIE